MRHDDQDEERRRCGLCGTILRPYDSISVAEVGQRCYRCFMLEEHLALPFGATVLGEAVVVEKIDLSGADELIAICRRRGKRQKVRLLDLELPVPRPKGAEWVAAYHRWSRRR